MIPSPRTAGALHSVHLLFISRTNDGTVCHSFSRQEKVIFIIHITQLQYTHFTSGKALNEQKTEIRIQFKDVTSGIFKDIPRNELVIRVQPNESVYIKMNSKLPGLSMQTAVTELDLTYRRRFSDLKIPEAYEALILDALKGDHSNFVRDDELDASWRIFTPLLHYLDENKEIIPMEYPYGKIATQILCDNQLTKCRIAWSGCVGRFHRFVWVQVQRPGRLSMARSKHCTQQALDHDMIIVLCDTI